jgi:DNA adenine methylase
MALSDAASPGPAASRAPKPLFRWAGGKQRFLWDHRHRLPAFTGAYHEPFAGGLSVFFHIAGRDVDTPRAFISDINLRLIRTYEQIKWEGDVVAVALERLAHDYDRAEDRAEFYNRVRAEHNRIHPSTDAARFIFLMAACWNGVYRENLKGEFNVPHGAPREKLFVPSAGDISAASHAFSQASLRAQPWQSAVAAARPGDFVFLDPPYFGPGRKDLYARGRSFGYSEHRELAVAASSLQQRGVDFLLTNAAYPEMVSLYNEFGLQVEEVAMHRSISSKVAERGNEGELVVTPGVHTRTRAERDAHLRLLNAARR